MNFVEWLKSIFGVWSEGLILGYANIGDMLFSPVFTINGHQFSFLGLLTAGGIYVVLMISFAHFILGR